MRRPARRTLLSTCLPRSAPSGARLFRAARFLTPTPPCSRSGRSCLRGRYAAPSCCSSLPPWGRGRRRATLPCSCSGRNRLCGGDAVPGYNLHGGATASSSTPTLCKAPQERAVQARVLHALVFGCLGHSPVPSRAVGLDTSTRRLCSVHSRVEEFAKPSVPAPQLLIALRK